MIFVWEKSSGGSLKEEFYVKKISLLLEYSKPGDEVQLNVHDATKIALSNGIPSGELNSIFNFDNLNNEVCVKLTRGRKTCYQYFNSVDVIEPRIKLGLGDEGTNVLTFKITEKRK